MVDERRAVRAFEAHLKEVIGVAEATAIADRFDHYVTREYLDRALSEALGRQSRELTAELTASWRRDLLLVVGAQFFALAGAVAALVALAYVRARQTKRAGDRGACVPAC